MDQFVSTNDLENILANTLAFLDNVYICSADQEDHDRCWNKIKKAAREHNFTFNEEKSVFSTSKLQILGSIVENCTITQSHNVYNHFVIYHHVTILNQ